MVSYDVYVPNRRYDLRPATPPNTQVGERASGANILADSHDDCSWGLPGNTQQRVGLIVPDDVLAGGLAGMFILLFFENEGVPYIIGLTHREIDEIQL